MPSQSLQTAARTRTGPARAPLCCGLAAVLLVAQAGPGIAQPAAPAAVIEAGPQARNATDQPGNISGVWQPNRNGPPPLASPVARPAPAGPFVYGPGEMHTADGDVPALQPWAAAIYKDHLKAEAAGNPYAGTMAQCLPHGMPGMALAEPYPIQILQTPGQVTVIHELMNSHRLIYLDEKLPEDPDPSYSGTSVGHWEGDTLVVTTIAIRDNTGVGNGIPHSDQLRTVERIRRLDANTLETVMTLDDPKAFLKPFRLRGTARLLPTTDRLQEYICENERHTTDAQGHTHAALKTGAAAQAPAKKGKTKRR